MNIRFKSLERRAVRRATRTECHAVELQDFRLLGERVLDLSPRGMLVACDDQVELGDTVVVSFKAPGPDGLWLDAEASVARIVEGWRPGDPGYCAGLDFTYFEGPGRRALSARLEGMPPPIPQRRLLSARQRIADREAVLVHGIIPLTNKKRPVPRGVFRQGKSGFTPLR